MDDVRPMTGTCRLQLHKDFTLARAAELVPYLDRLGVSHAYASPILEARPGSTHGYDVADFARVNPELGGDEARKALAAALRQRRMGLLLDIVPNHMGIGPSNPYWEDVLANGQQSRWAWLFDIDWASPKRQLKGKVLLPVLGDTLDAVLSRRELTIKQVDGKPRLAYFDSTWPLAPATHAFVDHFGAYKVEELRPLLAAQHYVLDFWKTGAKEINYRRFFDVNELAALRAEDPRTFEATHRLPLEWVQAGELDGLRIDHIDGLLEPVAYLKRLRDEVERRAPKRDGARGEFPILVEKILSPGEHLRPEWPVQGTTGYEFMNDLEAVFISAEGADAVEQGYRKALRLRETAPWFHDVAIRGKLRILRGPLKPDVDRLVRWVLPIAKRDPRSAALARKEIAEAVLQLLAFLPVYRTYVDDPARVDPRDVKLVDEALERALDRGVIPDDALHVVADILLLRDRGTTTGAQRAERLAFVQRFQQVSGPATAKGIEDTALYLYFPLSSRNEVGGEPDRELKDAVEAFHRGGAERAKQWPQGLLSTNTHDTKRSADVRARIDVLSEVPDEWLAAVARWRKQLAGLRQKDDGRTYPDANSEYLFLQTVVGIWPRESAAGGVPDAAGLESLAGRVHEYMLKASKEGKTMTSWTEPNEAFEKVLDAYVRGALDPARNREFLSDLDRFVGTIARAGYWNALARIALHFTTPGTPDLYQGDELWAFALVDPDNRRPVDWERRERVLAEVERAATPEARRALLREAVRAPEDGRVKLLLTRALLHARRDHPALFRKGGYRRLEATGVHANRVVAFAREHGAERVLVVAPRLTLGVAADGAAPTGARWGDTRLRVPDAFVRAEWRSALTGETLVAGDGRGEGFSLEELLAEAPVGCWIASGT